MGACLTLIPTPLAEDAPLGPSARAALAAAAADPQTLILVEESRPAWRRWLRWGLPREAIERFINFNEHTALAQTPQVLAALEKGQAAVLFSDAGMPAFCDPGTTLIAHCHARGIKVTATYFPQSMVLAWALAGFAGPFYFAGMLPGKRPAERRTALAQLLQRPEAVIFYDTPYRLAALGKDLASCKNTRHLFLACDLNSPQEQLFWGKACQQAFASGTKREFVAVLGPRGFKLPPLPVGGRHA